MIQLLLHSWIQELGGRLNTYIVYGKLCSQTIAMCIPEGELGLPR